MTITLEAEPQFVPGQTDLEIRGDEAVRQFILVKACKPLITHEHEYPHKTRCTKGSVLLRVFPDGRPVRLEAKRLPGGKWQPSRWVTVEAKKKHVVTPQEDWSEFECAFKHRDHDGNVVEVYQCGAVDERRCYR